MLNAETLAQILAAPSETVRLDFKERLGWNKGKRAQLEVVRDLACFANREGGNNRRRRPTGPGRAVGTCRAVRR
jgi:hypothetical protein